MGPKSTTRVIPRPHLSHTRFDKVPQILSFDDFEVGFAAMISGEAGNEVMDWGVTSSQNTQGANVASISDERPELATMGKTPNGRFVGENTGAALYRPQNQPPRALARSKC